MRKYNTQAVVLKSINYRDSDRIYTLLTKDYGKLSAIARGVRKISSRRSGNLDSLNCVKVKISENASGYRHIDEVSTLNSYGSLKSNYHSLIAAYYVAELVYKSLEEDSSAQDVYNLVIKTLNSLEKDMYFPKLIVARFELALLKLLGYDVNYLSSPVSKEDKDTLSLLRSTAWGDLDDNSVNRVEVLIKSYVYTFLADQMKSLEIMRLSS
ncbi:DNA repair protein RecO [Patescibacteria group bacterium]|nr:DNA repair protein RecO [Patescibacteria group bacterium]